ncbi:hypothetical protein Slin14017_G112180 [Septoria linicola]|nr:hypothetical protein Slin14017_G112180 [Septoria linicola]
MTNKNPGRYPPTKTSTHYTDPDQPVQDALPGPILGNAACEEGVGPTNA